jgi:hypothetical protein
LTTAQQKPIVGHHAILVYVLNKGEKHYLAIQFNHYYSVHS